jgi:hypothetical protein
LMVTCLATRPHWLLASTIPFSRSRCSRPQKTAPGGHRDCRERRADTHLSPRSTRQKMAASRRKASVSIRLWSPRADWRSYEPRGASASRPTAFLRRDRVARSHGCATDRLSPTFPIRPHFGCPR